MIDLTKEKPLSPDKAALMFGVHRRTIEQWFKAGLESVKLRGRRFTTRAALNRFAIHSQPFEAVSQTVNDSLAAVRELDRLGV